MGDAIAISKMDVSKLYITTRARNCYVGEAREEISMLMKGFQNRTNLAERQCGGCNYYFYTIMMEVQGLPFFLFSKYDDPATGTWQSYFLHNFT